ncbi:MAG: hypothetical protein IJ716_14605 [Lachnospiraceae bacterium]|nr:hypothetical protein [Lachnospiraceae bacterium]
MNKEELKEKWQTNKRVILTVVSISAVGIIGTVAGVKVLRHHNRKAQKKILDEVADWKQISEGMIDPSKIDFTKPFIKGTEILDFWEEPSTGNVLASVLMNSGTDIKEVSDKLAESVNISNLDAEKWALIEWRVGA